MFNNDRKKAVTAILGPEDPGVGIKEGEKPPEDETKHAIAKDALECIKNDDHEGFADALSAFHSFCSGGDVPEGE